MGWRASFFVPAAARGAARPSGAQGGVTPAPHLVFPAARKFCVQTIRFATSRRLLEAQPAMGRADLAILACNFSPEFALWVPWPLMHALRARMKDV
jgi:hypothetical protein